MSAGSDIRRYRKLGVWGVKAGKRRKTIKYALSYKLPCGLWCLIPLADSCRTCLFELPHPMGQAAWLFILQPTDCASQGRMLLAQYFLIPHSQWEWTQMARERPLTQRFRRWQLTCAERIYSQWIWASVPQQ